jgi:plastocyanin
MITWEFSNIVPRGGIGCTALQISNEGAANIDVDVQISGGGVTISPSAISVTLAAGASITVPVCAIAAVQSAYKNVDVQAIGQGSETTTHLNQQTKYAGFTAQIEQYARLTIRADQPYSEFCRDSIFNTSFTVTNYGNHIDTILVEVLNQKDLENAGFTVALPQPQIEIDAQGENQVPLNIRAGNATEIVEKGNYTLIVKASTTLAGETEAQNATATLGIVKCGEIVKPVEPGTPVAIAGDAVTVKPGETVQFNGAGTDDDGVIVLYEWDFNNDGVFEWSSEENGRITNIYNKEGTYTAVLRVTDDDGRTATDSRVITVGDGGGGGGDDSDDGFLPAPSLAAAVAAVAVIALRRRREKLN